MARLRSSPTSPPSSRRGTSPSPAAGASPGRAAKASPFSCRLARGLLLPLLLLEPPGRGAIDGVLAEVYHRDDDAGLLVDEAGLVLAHLGVPYPEPVDPPFQVLLGHQLVLRERLPPHHQALRPLEARR